MKKNLLLAFVIFCFIQITYSQSSQLDPSFGNNGIVQTDMGAPYNYTSFASQVLIPPGGNIYVILNATIVSARLSNGAVDSTYGFNGYSRSVPLADPAAALQADGKIVIAGSAVNGSFGSARLNVNGLPDSTFGNKGMLTIPLHPTSVAIQSDGKIVIAGYTTDLNQYSYFAVNRYNPDGSTDNTFNGTGQVITDFVFKLPSDKVGGDSLEFHNAFANTVAIQKDGKIVAGGYAYTGKDNDFAVVRYNVNGSADSTFDADGKQTTKIGTSDDVGNSLAIQSDGKIVLAGYTHVSTSNRFAVVRYNTNGSLDNLFNGTGKQTANIGSPDKIINNSVAIQSSGKIIVAGYAKNTVDNDFAVACFNTDGSHDKTFDKDGILTTDFTSSDDYAGSVAIQSDDKIVVAGYTISTGNSLQQFALTRYNTNGSLDNSFDDDGKLAGNFKQGYTIFNSVAIQPDKKIVAAGITWNGTNYDFAVTRYNSNGTPDSTFSDDGKQITDFGTKNNYANSVVIQKDGKIIVAGYSNSQFAIARYNPDGSLDNTFNETGKRLTALGFGDIGTSVALQSDGKIVMGGSTFTDANYDSSEFAIVRYNADGSLDNTFNGNGIVLTDIDSSQDFANSIAIQKDGKIILAGRSYLKETNNFSLVRYNTNGSLDNTFSNDGKQHNVFGGSGYLGQSVAIQNDGKIILAGYSENLAGTGSSFIAARYKTNGDLDSSFGNNGSQSTSPGVHLNLGTSTALLNDGRIAVGGTNDNFAIVLHKNDGSRDSTFGTDGIEITKISVVNSSIQSLAFSNNKLYAAGNGEFPGSFGVVARYLLPESGPVPINLLDFEAVLQNKSVVLNWKITTQKNLTKFVVERSGDGYKFTPLTGIPASGINTLTTNYSTTDQEPLQGVNFYRLKMFDADGKFTYSNIVAVKLNANTNLQIFPDPAKDILYVQATGENENPVLEIVDAAGKKIKEAKIYLNGNTSFSVDINSLSRGMYHLILHKKNKTEAQTFIKL